MRSALAALMRLLIGAVILVAAGYGVLFLLGLGFAVLLLWGGGPETDPGDYEDVRWDWDQSGLINYFPREIPASATDVRLYAAPSVLQGDGTFQLRLTLPPADVDALERRFAARALRDSTGALYEGAGGGLWDYTGEGHGRLAPAFTVYVVRAPVDPSWPHDAYSGVAVSRETAEVVYWAEQW